jgi:hypothetical protein
MDKEPGRPRYKGQPDHTDVPTGSEDALNGRITVDKRRLARLLKDAVDRRYKGNLNLAARESGIPQPTLHRWLNEKVANGERDKLRLIHRRHVAGIFTLIGDVAAALFIHPSGAYAKTLYVRWMDETIGQLLGLKVDADVLRGSPEAPWTGRQAEFQTILKRIQTQAPDVGGAINRVGSRLTFVNDECKEILATVGKILPRMKNDAAGNYVDPARFAVAVYRMLDPLLSSAASGWVERRHLELSPDEFRQFVSAGWRRETIMLNRKDDALRLQRLRFDIDDDPRLRPIQLARRRP